MLQAGQRLDDYRIVNLLASGGMGEIYLAEEVALGRQVAIKVIRPEAIKYPESEDARKVTQLFRREATAIARLSHPYILPLFRFGEATLDGNPLMYMVMPYCQEKSLPDWMYTRRKTIFSPQEVDTILRQAAEALQYAHDQGIIHLDVKPSNFLVRYQTNEVSQLNLQLTDFGVAKFTATSGMSQTVRGSLEYMAPEQWESNPVFATDQYALAVMVYKLLTGQAPFKGSRFEQLWHQHRYIQPPPPSAVNPSIPPSIDAVVLRALAKNPSDRFPSVLAFADAYRQALQTQVGKTEYAPLHLPITLTQEEAIRGTTRMLSLPSGEVLPVTTPPGAYQGQVITIPRQNAPTVIVTIQVPTATIPPPPPPPPPRSNPNRARTLVAAVLALVLVIGGIIGGVSVHNQQQGNAQATATAQSNQATQGAINAQQTQDAQATQTALATSPNIQGSYSGNYQFPTLNSSGTVSLNITQQNGQTFGGTCVVDNGGNLTIDNGMVDTSGNIQFSITGTDSSGNTVTWTFTGTAQSGGGWQGTLTDNSGNQGTWSAM